MKQDITLINRLINRLESLRNEIHNAEINAHRTIGSTQLVAVTKFQSFEDMMILYNQGIINFAENYLQEALTKMNAFSTVKVSPCWHFIGRLQSNKLKKIAQNFDWVQSVDNIKHAKLLNDERPNELSPLQICLQINVPGFTHAVGISELELSSTILTLNQYPKLKIRGLMVMPNTGLSDNELQNGFNFCHEIFIKTQKKFPQLDTLSMGMSNDYLQAIKAGANLIRIGTRLFGERTKANTGQNPLGSTGSTGSIK